MIEAGRTSPKVIQLIRWVHDEQVFLRMAATELRRIAEQDADIAAELREMAQRVEAEADSLARQQKKRG